MSRRQASILLPHGGGPCFFMPWTMGPPDTWAKTRAFLESISSSLQERPRGMVVVSGHWEEPVPTVSTAEHPPLIFDYYGFPPETYQLTWPAPGAPDLARKIGELLKSAGGAESRPGLRSRRIRAASRSRFPQADIPVAALSLAGSLDPALHLAVGRALAPYAAFAYPAGRAPDSSDGAGGDGAGFRDVLMDAVISAWRWD